MLLVFATLVSYDANKNILFLRRTFSHAELVTSHAARSDRLLSLLVSVLLSVEGVNEVKNKIRKWPRKNVNLLIRLLLRI